jgi:hypothetical protein
MAALSCLLFEPDGTISDRVPNRRGGPQVPMLVWALDWYQGETSPKSGMTFLYYSSILFGVFGANLDQSEQRQKHLSTNNNEGLIIIAKHLKSEQKAVFGSQSKCSTRLSYAPKIATFGGKILMVSETNSGSHCQILQAWLNQSDKRCLFR